MLGLVQYFFAREQVNFQGDCELCAELVSNPFFETN